MAGSSISLPASLLGQDLAFASLSRLREGWIGEIQHASGYWRRARLGLLVDAGKRFSRYGAETCLVAVQDQRSA